MESLNYARHTVKSGIGHHPIPDMILVIARLLFDIDIKLYLRVIQTITMTNILEVMLAMFLAIILILSLPFFFMTNAIDEVDENGLKVLN